MPPPNTKIKFGHYNKKLRVPFAIYADFESFTKKIDDKGKYQEHVPSGFCYYVVYRDGMIFKPVKYTGANVAEEFC